MSENTPKTHLTQSATAPPMSHEAWYAEGLRFTCTQCGNCCTGPPGYVWFSEAELTAMAKRFDMTESAFLEKYGKIVEGYWSLDEVWNPEVQGYDCVFLRRDESGKALCSIYEDRPTQCRTWPFWPSMLTSKRAYRRATADCPGAQKGLKQGEGTLVPLEQIRILRDATPER